MTSSTFVRILLLKYQNCLIYKLSDHPEEIFQYYFSHRKNLSVISTVDDEYKRTEGFMNYYGIAHLYKEKVTEQPAIMRYGKLKPYQVCNLSKF